MPDHDAPLTDLWSDARRLWRYLWFVVLVVAAAVTAALMLPPASADVVRARQAMTLEQTSWSDIPTAHLRNEVWLEENLPDDLDIELDRAGEQTFEFVLVAVGSDEAEVRAGLATAMDGLETVNPAWLAASQRRRAELESQAVEIQASLVPLRETIAVLRVERAGQVARAEWPASDVTGAGLQLAEEEERRLADELGWIERRLNELDVDETTLPVALPVGEPRLETETPSLSSTSLALLVGFGAALVAGVLALSFDRRWGRLVGAAQLARVVPGRRVMAFDSRTGAEAGSADLAAVARQVVKGSSVTVVVLDTTAGAGVGVALGLQRELRAQGSAGVVIDGDDLDPGAVAALEMPQRDLRIVTVATTATHAEWMAAHAEQAVVVIPRRIRGHQVTALVRRLDELGVEVLLIALIDDSSTKTGSPRSEPLPDPVADPAGDIVGSSSR